MVGDTVEVRILDVRGGQVKIGVVASREISIYRIEISRLNQRAALANLEEPQVRSVIAVVRKTLLERRGAAASGANATSSQPHNLAKINNPAKNDPA